MKGMERKRQRKKDRKENEGRKGMEWKEKERKRTKENKREQKRIGGGQANTFKTTDNTQKILLN